MMGTYIKGFKPQDGLYVIKDGVIRKYKGKGGTVRPYELVEVKEPHGRVFKGIVVEYPSYNTYPEYEGKPYFQIKYTEKGQEFIGYGTYKPEVLSEYLKEYFMPSAQPKRGKWIDAVIPNDNGDLFVQVCDQCNTFFPLAYTGGGHHFCPNCGADMRGEQNE